MSVCACKAARVRGGVSACARGATYVCSEGARESVKRGRLYVTRGAYVKMCVCVSECVCVCERALSLLCLCVTSGWMDAVLWCKPRRVVAA